MGVYREPANATVVPNASNTDAALDGERVEGLAYGFRRRIGNYRGEQHGQTFIRIPSRP